MNKIKKVPLNRILFFDIECASANEQLELDSKEYELFEYQNRDRVTGDFLPSEELQDLYKKTAALSPIFGRVVCVSIGFIHDDTIHIKSIKGEESDIIEEFYSLIKPGTILAAFNGCQFDTPYLRIRAQKHNLQHLIPENIDDSGLKEWNLTEKNYKVNYIEIMNLFKGTMFRNMSLDSACYINGIDSPKNGEVSGHNVSKAFYEGRIDEIVDYCNQDIVATINLFLKMTSRPIIENVVVRGEEQKEDLQSIEIDILELLYTNKDFNDEVKIKVKEHVSKVKMTKKDWVFLETCLYSLYINTKIMHKDADSKKALVEKKEEISKFIEEIKNK